MFMRQWSSARPPDDADAIAIFEEWTEILYPLMVGPLTRVVATRIMEAKTKFDLLRAASCASLSNQRQIVFFGFMFVYSVCVSQGECRGLGVYCILFRKFELCKAPPCGGLVPAWRHPLTCVGRLTECP